MKYLVDYNARQWAKAYNQILYNQLLKTVMNNEETLFKDVDKKLANGVKGAKEFHAQINASVKNDEDAAQLFIKVICRTLVDAVGKALTEEFEGKMIGYESNVTKDSIL